MCYYLNIHFQGQKVNMKEPQPLETSRTISPTTQRNIADRFTDNWILFVNLKGTRQVM